MRKHPHIGVILSGCGVYDGSEIHEAVITLLCLAQQDATYKCMAPRKALEVIDHVTRKPTGEKRDVYTEAARIARGDIADLAQVKVTDYDGFILPGGFGAAKNLSTFATDGPGCSVDAQVQRVLTEAHAAGLPLGFVCIAPAIAAKLFGSSLHPTLTIGKDPGTAKAMTIMGINHVPCEVEAVVTDPQHRILSTPAYMDAKSIRDVYTGIEQLVMQLLEMGRKVRD